MKSRQHDSLRLHRFAGLSLGGGKSSRTALAVLEYFPDQKRIFLSELRDKIQSEAELSADLLLHDLLSKAEPKFEIVAVDAPLQFPKCITCKLKCPGFEVCTEPEIKWQRRFYEERNRRKKPFRAMTPYNERCAEIYVSNELEEAFAPSQAFGANSAPLAARAHYMTRRLDLDFIEFFPRLSLWRIGRSLGVQKSYLRSHRHAVEGSGVREAILKQLIEKNVAFVYFQDLRSMIENSVAFDAFIGAMTAFLKFNRRVEKRPRGYPKNEAWIEIPEAKINWGGF